MAEQDEKSRLPLAGFIALIATISSWLVYEGISLQTSRPIDKERGSNISLEKELVQSRLWQDPFEAVERHKVNEEKRFGDGGKSGPHAREREKQAGRHTIQRLIEIVRK
jgi:hypothetical protein